MVDPAETMTATKVIAICFAAVGGVSGIISARYWYESSRISVTPPWGDFEPLEAVDKAVGWASATLDALIKSAALNKKAARWTAASVLLSAVAGVLGNLP